MKRLFGLIFLILIQTGFCVESQKGIHSGADDRLYKAVNQVASSLGFTFACDAFETNGNSEFTITNPTLTYQQWPFPVKFLGKFSVFRQKEGAGVSFIGNQISIPPFFMMDAPISFKVDLKNGEGKIDFASIDQLTTLLEGMSSIQMTVGKGNLQITGSHGTMKWLIGSQDVKISLNQRDDKKQTYSFNLKYADMAYQYLPNQDKPQEGPYQKFVAQLFQGMNIYTTSSTVEGTATLPRLTEIFKNTFSKEYPLQHLLPILAQGYNFNLKTTKSDSLADSNVAFAFETKPLAAQLQSSCNVLFKKVWQSFVLQVYDLVVKSAHADIGAKLVQLRPKFIELIPPLDEKGNIVNNFDLSLQFNDNGIVTEASLNTGFSFAKPEIALTITAFGQFDSEKALKGTIKMKNPEALIDALFPYLNQVFAFIAQVKGQPTAMTFSPETIAYIKKQARLLSKNPLSKGSDVEISLDFSNPMNMLIGGKSLFQLMMEAPQETR